MCGRNRVVAVLIITAVAASLILRGQPGGRQTSSAMWSWSAVAGPLITKSDKMVYREVTHNPIADTLARVSPVSELIERARPLQERCFGAAAAPRNTSCGAFEIGVVAQRNRPIQEALGLHYARHLALGSFYFPSHASRRCLCPERMPSSQVMTMSGAAALDVLIMLADDLLDREVPGDLVDAGCWRGGKGAVLATLLRLRGDRRRAVHLADSFSPLVVPRGAPQPWATYVAFNSFGLVRLLFDRFGLSDGRNESIRAIVGVVAAEVPQAARRGDFSKGVALLSIDSDSYDDVAGSLCGVYPLIPAGGCVVLLSYYRSAFSHRAAHDYRTAAGVMDPIVPIFEGEEAVGVWWQKSTHSGDSSAKFCLRTAVAPVKHTIVDADRIFGIRPYSFRLPLYDATVVPNGGVALSPFSTESSEHRVGPDDHIRSMQMHPQQRCHITLANTVKAAESGSCRLLLPRPTYRAQGEIGHAIQTSMTLIKAIVVNSLFRHADDYIDGSRLVQRTDWMSMAGLRRLSNVHWLVEDALARNIPGDVIETGTWRGGMMATVAAFLRMVDATDRVVWLADTFSGIPLFRSDKTTKQDRDAHSILLLKQNSPELVKEFMRRLLVSGPGVTGPRMEYLVGRFDRTLRPAADSGRFRNGFMVVRLDGDTYHSTMDALQVLYPLLHPGGFLIVDDYLDWLGCYNAINEYRALNNITDPIVPVYHERKERVRGVWWKKS